VRREILEELMMSPEFEEALAAYQRELTSIIARGIWLTNWIRRGTRHESSIYFDISNEDYHAGDGVSKSQLDMVAMSPALLHGRNQRRSIPKS
jgi:hypothetical protein